jgi:hypothetical protein
MFATTLLIAFAAMAEDGPHPTITLREMPEALRAAWSHNLPDMNANSRCAVAFDSQVEQNRMCLSVRCTLPWRQKARDAPCVIVRKVALKKGSNRRADS